MRIFACQWEAEVRAACELASREPLRTAADVGPWDVGHIPRNLETGLYGGDRDLVVPGD